MFFDCQGPGMCFAIPDICKTPITPFPHVDFCFEFMAIPNVTNILWCCMPAHNKKTKVPLTLGDFAGIGLGVRYPNVMGPEQKIMGTRTFLIKGGHATRVTNPTKQNGNNARGLLLVPPQLKAVNLCA